MPNISQMKPFEAFMIAIRIRESSDDYRCVNALGYLGAYQFGMARLADLGLTKRIDPKSHYFKNSDFAFKAPLSASRFLASPELQDFVFMLHVADYARRIEKHFGTLSNLNSLYQAGQRADLSGAVAVCHLLGLGGLIDLLQYAKDGTDDLGTSASSYLKEFAGYQILC